MSSGENPHLPQQISAKWLSIQGDTGNFDSALGKPVFGGNIRLLGKTPTLGTINLNPVQGGMPCLS